MGKRRRERCQVGIKKVSDELTDGSIETWNGGVKSGVCTMLHDKSGDTCLLPRRHPAYSRHELDPGSCVEHGSSSRDAKRKPSYDEAHEGEKYRCL
jgi:hypothetical protein